jgi:hypothetical protein
LALAARDQKAATYFTQDDFKFNKRWTTCICPTGEKLTLKRVADNGYGKETTYFEGRLLQCRPLKERCMKNPAQSGAAGTSEQY